MRIIGLAGWSGSGKTTLVTKVIPVLVKRGLKVATIKHAHHEFDIDQPGKDFLAAPPGRRQRSGDRLKPALGHRPRTGR